MPSSTNIRPFTLQLPSVPVAMPHAPVEESEYTQEDEKLLDLLADTLASIILAEAENPALNE